ncbi:protein S40-6-like [Salvia miltiorrhiza]|uniref:protein S40-6-like n=1 Tax=Salvia miltiorrhiza TaxID=226208 RepID=UPI0025ABCB1F|nr:protein S40-6-like [Salvia miltiorrhiza]
MEELLEDRRSTAMSTSNPSSSHTLRFLGFTKQPESAPTLIHDPLELHESDVVWSFAVSTAPPPRHHHQHLFNPANSGLSAALSDDHRHLIRRKSTVSHAMLAPAARQEEVPPPRFHQSAPMNVPRWPKELHRRCGNGNLDGLDEEEDDGAAEEEEEEEIVPPHVIVARSHVTFSVFEGAGRTLKGRDLRRVRNAVFQKTGFID